MRDGKAVGNVKTAETSATFRWILEPADPLLAVRDYPAATTLPVLVQVVSAGGTGIMEDAPLHSALTQTLLAGTFNRAPVADTTFVMETGGAPICDDATAVVGAILQPCTASSSPTYLPSLGKLSDMRTQLGFFLATGTTCNVDTTCP